MNSYGFWGRNLFYFYGSIITTTTQSILLQTGKLKDQWVLIGFPYVDVDYCKYGMPYRKRTRLWNEVSGLNKEICVRKTVIAWLVINILLQHSNLSLKIIRQISLNNLSYIEHLLS